MRCSSVFSKYILFFAVVAFFSVGFLGLGHTTMVMDPDGAMPVDNCVMPGMTEALCQMNPLEHIAAWQGMFASVLNQSDVSLLLASLLTLILGALIVYAWHSTLPLLIRVLRHPSRYRSERIPFIRPLQEAFSSGILHPKIF